MSSHWPNVSSKYKSETGMDDFDRNGLLLGILL